MRDPDPGYLVAVLGLGVVGTDEPILTGDDLGLTRGDGIFDATSLTVLGGRVEVRLLEPHLGRFARSAASMGLPAPDEVAWRALIDEATAAWAAAHPDGEAVLRLICTRGRETHRPGLGGSTSTGVLTIAALEAATIRARAGVVVHTLSRGHASDAFRDAPWLLGGVKSLSYAVNMAAQRLVAERDDGLPTDVLFTSTDGYVLEAPRSAVVWLRDGALGTTTTTGTGILRSVTQEEAFTGARQAGVATSETLITPDGLIGADAVWLLSAGRGPTPVLAIDGRPIGRADEWTARLREWTQF